MNFYVFEGKRIRVRELRGKTYIDPLDDSACHVYRDKDGNLYVLEGFELCNPDEFWARGTGVYKNKLKRVPERSVSDYCPLLDQVENGYFDGSNDSGYVWAIGPR